MSNKSCRENSKKKKKNTNLWYWQIKESINHFPLEINLPMKSYIYLLTVS